MVPWLSLSSLGQWSWRREIQGSSLSHSSQAEWPEPSQNTELHSQRYHEQCTSDPGQSEGERSHY